MALRVVVITIITSNKSIIVNKKKLLDITYDFLIKYDKKIGFKT